MKRRIFSFLFIAATLGLIVFIAFSNSDLTNAWEALFTLKTEWLLCAFLGWFGYMFFDMLGLYYFLRKQKYPISLGVCHLYHAAWLLLLQHHPRLQRRAADAGVLPEQA